MRAWISLASFLTLAACGQSPEYKSQNKELTVLDVREESTTDSAGPGIGVTAAPGVAFNYRYAFRLPSNRISAAQEAHAAMCEKLGIARCRIAGMRYRLENERDVSAMLELKLEPTIARAFGKAATGVVTRSAGMLVDQEISGVDAGASIADANRSQARAADDVARVEAELRRSGLNAATRERLLAEAADLRRESRSIAVSRDADRASLAQTPMLFDYGSGSLIPGFDTTSPIRDALATTGANFVGAAAAIVTVLALLLPWSLLLALVVWLVRRLRPKWPGRLVYGAPGVNDGPPGADVSASEGVRP